jgi:hypothetical protein
MTDPRPDGEPLEPRVHTGRRTPPFPPPDWELEVAEAKARERERLAADHDDA